jgi:hypothetical protein
MADTELQATLKYFGQYCHEEHPEWPAPRLSNEMCSRCDGNGTHGNPAFDGTTTEWWLEGDPFGDDLEEYMHGDRYDVSCEECDGERIVKVLLPENNTPEIMAAWEEWLRDYYEGRAVEAQERRMGA